MTDLARRLPLAGATCGGGPRSGFGVRLAAASALLVIGALLFVGPTSASAQVTPGAVTTTVPVSGTTVAGGSADGAVTETESSPRVVAAGSDHRLLTEDRKILGVVGGLVVVALALTLLTIRYWRQTKPVRPPVEPPSPARHLVGGAGVSSIAVPATTDAEPVLVVGASEATAVHDLSPEVELPTPSRPPATPAAAPAATAASARASRPATAPPESLDRRSRRAVAGADHRSADDDWNPRGTGENERVEVTTAPRGSRPGRAAREAALKRSAPES